jgi:hypothetical protein
VADGFEHVRCSDKPEPNHDVVEPFAGAVLLCNGQRELVIGNQTAFNKY